MFVFDETFRTLQGQGRAIVLAPWYGQAEISILKMAFVCGCEEVALVDSSARVRIFSFITLQFRFVSPPFYKFSWPCPAQQLVDRRSCSFKLPPMPYTHHQMDPASSFFVHTIRGHRSLHIIWRRLARLRELHYMFPTFPLTA